MHIAVTKPSGQATVYMNKVDTTGTPSIPSGYQAI